MPPTDQPREPQTPPQVLHALVDAVYGGWERPADDPGILRAIADYLDRVDDVPDNLARSIGHPWRVGRDMQRDLRRIADEAAADALRERDEAVRLLREAVNALEWCDSRYRQTLAGKSVRDVAEMRAYIGRTLSEARTFLRRFEGESG